MYIRVYFLMRKALGLLLFLLIPWELQGAAEVHAVLVFPFENQGSRSDLNWISESFAEVISSRLSGPGYYVLERNERNAAYDQLGIPADTPLTVASEYKAAQILGVDWAILGDFDVKGDRLSASARLLDVRHLKLSSPIEVTGELADLVDLQTRLVWRLVASYDTDFVVGTEEDFRRRFPDVRLDAFENYIRGILATDDLTREHFLLEADRLNPADHGAAYALGQFFFDQKDYSNSAKWLKRLDAGDTHYYESLFLLGVDEFFLGHYQSSEKAFEGTAREIPLNEVLNNIGVLKSRRAEYAEALDDFERAQKGDPTDEDFCFNRGVALWNLHRYKAAEQTFEETIHLKDDDAEAHTLLAVVLGKLGDSAGERRQVEWLSRNEIDSDTGLSRDVLPQPRLKKNFDGRAFRLLSLAVRNVLEERLKGLSPAEHAAVHKSLGKKLASEERFSEAEHELTEATSLVPGDSDAHLSLAQTFEAGGKHQEAAGEFRTALKLEDSFAGHFGLARVYVSLNQPEQARKECEAALKFNPNSREAQELLRQIPSRPSSRKKES